MKFNLENFELEPQEVEKYAGFSFGYKSKSWYN